MESGSHNTGSIEWKRTLFLDPWGVSLSIKHFKYLTILVYWQYVGMITSEINLKILKCQHDFDIPVDCSKSDEFGFPSIASPPPHQESE